MRIAKQNDFDYTVSIMKMVNSIFILLPKHCLLIGQIKSSRMILYSWNFINYFSQTNYHFSLSIPQSKGQHTRHPLHTKQFAVACKSFKIDISILLWFTKQVYWPWLAKNTCVVGTLNIYCNLQIKSPYS